MRRQLTGKGKLHVMISSIQVKRKGKWSPKMLVEYYLVVGMFV